MSTNQVTVFNSAVRPSFAVKGALSATTLALAGGGASGKRLSIRGGVFRLITDGKEVAAIDERYLDVIIVKAADKVARTYYDKTFDENEAASPACWSPDGDHPDKSVKAPQCASCAACPQNVKGSGQGDTRACRYSQRVAVVLANDVEGDVLQLSLPATSLFGKAEGDNRPLQEYARFMAAQGNDISMLVTRMRFDTTAATPKLFFKPMRWLTDEEYAITSKASESSEALSAVTYTVFQQDTKALPAPVAGTPPKAAKPAPVVVEPEPEAQVDDEPPPPPPKKTRAAPAKAAKPAPMPDDEPPAPEPTVRKAAPAAPAPAASAGLAAVLGEWDDE
jgi:hypothetical protein